METKTYKLQLGIDQHVFLVSSLTLFRVYLISIINYFSVIGKLLIDSHKCARNLMDENKIIIHA